MDRSVSAADRSEGPRLVIAALQAIHVVYGLFFALAATHAIELDTAFVLAKWSGLGLICGYGFVAARLSGSRVGRSVVHAGILGLVGGALIALKALVH